MKRLHGCYGGQRRRGGYQRQHRQHYTPIREAVVKLAPDPAADTRCECRARGLVPVSIVFTSSVCGSMRTLDFLRRLGVEVPRWIENDLRRAADPLHASLEQAAATAAELITYCRRLEVPSGLNIDSVSIRREEIEAPVQLAARLSGHLRAQPS